MGTKQSHTADDLFKLLEALVFDLPAAATGRLFASGDDRGVNEAGWKVYDAWISLANDAINRVYANRTFGEAAGRSIEAMLRWHRMTDAVSSAFFGSLWPAIGLPTATEVQGLRAELGALREELRQSAEAADQRATRSEFGSDVMRMFQGSDSTIWAAYAPEFLRQMKESKADAV